MQRVRVLAAIQFDDQTAFVADEVNNVSADRCLPAEAQSIKTMSAQLYPQHAFGICHRGAH
jgi:hypothetical protein